MDSIHTTCIIGFALFCAVFVALLAAWIYYGVTGRQLALQYRGVEYKVKWAKAQWLYLVFLFAVGFYAVMYMMQYLDQGFTEKPSGLVVIWVRWIFVGIVGLLAFGTLTHVMTAKPHGPQSLVATMCYGLALFALLAGSLSLSQGQRLLWVVVSVLSFLASWALLLFPQNKIWDAQYYRVRDVAFSERCSTPSSDTQVLVWAYSYRIIMLASLTVSYVAYLLIWTLNDANELTSVISLYNAMIAYLFFDLLSLAPFALMFTVLTFRRLTYKLDVTERQSGKKLTLTARNGVTLLGE